MDADPTEHLPKQDEELAKEKSRLNTLVAIAVALTGKRWLYWVAMIPTVFGVLMGLAGLFGWGIHPDALTRLLS